MGAIACFLGLHRYRPVLVWHEKDRDDIYVNVCTRCGQELGY